MVNFIQHLSRNAFHKECILSNSREVEVSGQN
uniref:Uncharacterized protein n=1 Tax=Anguilla anguilla TaxID=7936 RepID=A0A0E9WEY6_ANGAN